MKGVETIARVRREFFVRGRTIKEICRDLHVSRNTVRKILRSEAPALEGAARNIERIAFGPTLAQRRAEIEQQIAVIEQFERDRGITPDVMRALGGGIRTTPTQQRIAELRRELFEAFHADPGCLPPEWQGGGVTAVCDYVAGMTDGYALDEHRRLFDVTTRA